MLNGSVDVLLIAWDRRLFLYLLNSLFHIPTWYLLHQGIITNTAYYTLPR